MTSSSSALPTHAPPSAQTIEEVTNPELAGLLLQEGRERPAEALYWSAVRTRSPLALKIARRLASPDRDFEQLLALSSGPESSEDQGIDAPYLGALAATLARRREYDDAYKLFRLTERIAPEAIIPEYQVRYAEAALAVTGSATKVLGAFDGIPERQRRAFESDQAHPERGGDQEEWLHRFRAFTGMADLVLTGDDGKLYFDRLTTEPLEPVHGSRRISVIMTCYQPDETLFTAVGSVLAQTWQNWELLLVDDCSGPGYDDILKRAAALDDRVRLFRLPVNSGTYRARNRALVECKGVFVTGLDSDDWAHPRWLERQVQPLLRDSKLVMTFANCIRVRENLTAIHTGRPVHGPRSTSVMFRAAPVRKRMGYFDALRKGADTEFHFRFKTVFGRRAVWKIKDEIFTLVRLGDETLTSKEIGSGWQHPGRFAYQSAHHHWRQRIRRGEADPFIAADQPHREFFAPSLNRGVRLDGRRFDELYVADCRFWEASQQQVVERAATAAAAGKTVGILHIESLLRLRVDNRYLRPEILDFLNDSGVEFVGSVDPVSTDRLVVSDPSLWDGREGEYALAGTGDVELWEQTIEPSSSLETAAPREETMEPRRPPRSAKRRRSFKRRVAVVGLMALLTLYGLAISSLFLADFDIAAVSVFLAVSGSIGCCIFAFTRPGFHHFSRLIAKVVR